MESKVHGLKLGVHQTLSQQMNCRINKEAL